MNSLRSPRQPSIRSRRACPWAVLYRRSHNLHAVKLRVVDLVLEARSGGADAIYTYGLEIDAREGDALLAPLGNRTVMGYAMRIREIHESELGFPIASLRNI